jgi:hypothetical protein
VGLFDYFRRRRERESAIPQSSTDSTGFSATSTASPPAPMPQAGQSPAVMNPAMMQQMMVLQRLMSEHEVNLTQQPIEVRQAVASDLQSRGINAQVGGALQVTDPQQIQDVVEVLKNHGLLPPDTTVN